VTNKCATLKHGGRFGGSLSPNPKNIAQPHPPISQQQQQQQQYQQTQQQQQQQPQLSQQHIQLQQHHLQKPNNQQLELQTYQLQQDNFQQNLNISTVSRDYNQQYPTTTLPYRKPGTGFIETSSILKKHRDEVSEMVKPVPSVFSVEPTSHRQSEPPAPKSISIINQPLPEIPKNQSKPPQVLCASNLPSSYPTNYRSLQRPAPVKPNYPSGTTQRGGRERDRSSSTKVVPPVLPPKNRNSLNRAQQPLPFGNSNQNFNQQYPSRGYERERSRERILGRSYDDSHQSRSSSKHHQLQQMMQQNFQTLPHHHHHPSMGFSSNTGLKSKSDKRGPREVLKQPFENYSATEL
jgi:hypothetical protein